MSILSRQSIPSYVLEPFVPQKTLHPASGTTYGLSHCGYDVRLAQDLWFLPGQFRIASTLERFYLPNWLMARVCDKSTLARRGFQLFNTVIEPGWQGFLTLEIKNQSFGFRRLRRGQPIAQIIFEQLDQPTDVPYAGKYQNQPNRPVHAIKQMQDSV